MFEKATKEKCKLRLAITGVSGAGKTFSALRIASALGTKIAFIDTETRSARKYSDRFNFDVKELAQPSIDNIIEAIEFVNKNNYDVLIIDSLSHAWQELLDEIDKLAKTKYQGNSFRAWGEGTPKQKRLIKAILECNAHVIGCMRAKTEYVVSTNDKGKASPQKVGMGTEQGKGIEYEFDMLMEISRDHIAEITKDRTGKFQDAVIEKPDEAFGKEILAWLDSAPEPETLNRQEAEAFKAELTQRGYSPTEQKVLLTEKGISKLSAIRRDEIDSILADIPVKEAK